MVAGEAYHIDSQTPLRSPLDDYDYAWLRELAKRKRSILDAGSSVGLTALMFARHMDPSGTCVLFDGSKVALKRAAANLLAAGPPAPSIFLCYSWVGADTDSASPVPGLIPCAAPITTINAELDGLSKTPPPLSLDGICRRHDLRPDLVKVDVEGAEHDALAGAAWLAEVIRPIFQVELHTFNLEMEEAASRVIEWCRQWEYEPWYLKRHERLTDPAQLSERRRCHVLLLPAGAPYPEELRPISQGTSAIHAV